MRIFIDYAITDECVNDDAYETCLQCNECGRFDKPEEKLKEREETTCSK